MIIEYAEKINKRVIVSGLCGDSKRTKFGSIADLLHLTDDIALLHASCTKCARDLISVPAPFTHRICDESDVVVIGGSDKYIPLCRKHYLEMNK